MELSTGRLILFVDQRVWEIYGELALALTLTLTLALTLPLSSTAARTLALTRSLASRARRDGEPQLCLPYISPISQMYLLCLPRQVELDEMENGPAVQDALLA